MTHPAPTVAAPGPSTVASTLGRSPAAGGVPFYAAQAGECELFTHCFEQHLPLLIKGPTGCGKTRFVEHMAAR